ncbi:MAG: DedA family protein [Coriobacteriia bacterium]|nr:DedA family protein [Coriobacteriia bacterium]
MFELTGIAWLDVVLGFVSAHGYLATFLGGVLENVFIVGGFMPGETVVMGVSFVASRTRELSPVLIWIASVLGTMAGSNVSYAIGYRGGRPMLQRIGTRFPKLEGGIFKAEEYFDLHGSKTVFISRFTAGFKNWMPTIAGATHMSIPIFELYTLLSAVVYSTGLVIIGYYFGEQMDVIVAWFKSAGLWATFALVAALAGYIGFRVWRSRSIEHQVEEHLVHEAENAADDADAE